MVIAPTPSRDRLKAPPSSPMSQQVLAHAQASREVVQEYCPLAESLEWELGQQYFRDRGNKAFISDAIPVPFLINNDGTQSRNAAEVLFTSCVEADKKGDLEREIFVLEIGIGVGLFARFFLDNFRDLCLEHKKDYYNRLCYIAADRSQRMLHDMLRHGLLAGHPGRYRVRVLDAMEPENLRQDVMFRELNHGEKREHGEKHPHPSPRDPVVPVVKKQRPILRAVFLNYLLDCLPAAVLEFKGDQVNQLCVRTCLARNVTLGEHTDMSALALRERAKSKDPKARDELMEVYSLFASEYCYRPADVKQIPYGDFAVDFGRQHGKRLMHNYGAIQCLERLLDLVHLNGFILMNEYGMKKVGRDDEYEHQRFSMATAVGLNFPLVMAYFDRPQKLRWVDPVVAEGRGIETRLLGHQPADATIEKFHERFCRHAIKEHEEPVQHARACQKAGRFEMAADFYQKALERQPRNWYLMGEISSFLTYQMRDVKAGIDMAKLALAQNPACSAELWNILGDALYEFGRMAEARSAYLKALAVNSADVRARHNLAWVYTREKDYPKALQMVAEALSHDKTGQLRDRLLQKQSEILALQAAKHQQEYLLYVNFVSRDPKKHGASETETPEAVSAIPEKKD